MPDKKCQYDAPGKNVSKQASQCQMKIWDVMSAQHVRPDTSIQNVRRNASSKHQTEMSEQMPANMSNANARENYQQN